MKKDNNSSNKNAYLYLELAVLFFLIVLFGSLVGLTLTRIGANNFVLKNKYNENENETYIEYEDGSRENISDGVVNAEFEYDGLIFSHFEIESTESTCTLKVEIENTTNLDIEEKTFLVSFYDALGDELTETVTLTTDGAIASNSMQKIIAPIRDDVVTATSIGIELVGNNEDNTIASGDIDNSGDVQ